MQTATATRSKPAAPRLTRSRWYKLLEAILHESSLHAAALAALRDLGVENRMIESVDRCSRRRIQRLMKDAGCTWERYEALLQKYGMPPRYRGGAA